MNKFTTLNIIMNINKMTQNDLTSNCEIQGKGIWTRNKINENSNTQYSNLENLEREFTVGLGGFISTIGLFYNKNVKGIFRANNVARFRI
jgi:hypothetical protein